VSKFIAAFAAGILLLASTGCVSTGNRSLEIEPNATLSEEIGTNLLLSIPAGDVNISVSPDDLVRVRVQFYCSPDSEKCAAMATGASIGHSQVGDQSTISFSPSSAYAARHANIRYHIQVPTMAETMTINMDAGDLDIEGLRTCTTVFVGAGDIDILVPISSVASVQVNTKVGDASIRLPGGRTHSDRSMLLGARASWREGDGSCAMAAELAAGDIQVRLTDD